MDDAKTVIVTPASPVHVQHGALIASVEIPTPILTELWRVEQAGEAGLVLELPCRVRLVNGFVLQRSEGAARASVPGPGMTTPEMMSGHKVALAAAGEG